MSASLNIEDLLIYLRKEEVESESYYPDDTSMREGYTQAIIDTIEYIEEENKPQLEN